MRAVIQRVTQASVSVGGQVIGTTGDSAHALLVFLGVAPQDDATDLDWLLDRLIKVRVFEDAAQKMNQSILDVRGSILLISQFTLFGSLKKGNRPSFNRAAPPDFARNLYERFAQRLSTRLDGRVATGCFGEFMEIHAVHDGPVTLVIDTQDRDF